jgi:hypothetical protein
VITYEQVIEEYLEEQKLDGQGNLRPAQVLKNKRSHVKSWLEWQNLTPSSPVGEELGIHFNTSKIAFLDHLEGEGKCSQTRQDRKSTVLGLHYMHIELMHTSGLPVSFAAALNVLFQESGMSLTALAKRVGVSWQTLNDWVNDNHVPRPISVPSIHNLEDSFKLSRGTLTSRLPDALWMATGFQ